MKKKHIASIALASWLTLIIVFMILTQNIDIEVFFVFGFIGLLITMKLMEQRFVQPAYLQYFWYLIIIGIMIFSVIAVLRTIKYI